MTAVRAVLDAKTLSSIRRVSSRRKLRLQAQGSAASGATDVLILDVSTTGLLLQTAGDLAKGETIELDIPEALGVRVVVKWTSGQLFGCQFREPISTAAVSAALLRAPYEPPSFSDDLAQPDFRDFGDQVDKSGREGELSIAAKITWNIGLAVLSWIAIAAAVSVVWRYFH